MTNARMLSVVIPVFDERNTVGEVVRRVRMVELPEGVDREIIVVDDGSRDGTDKVLRALEDSTVRVVRHPANQGQGAAVRTGLGYVRGDVVLIQDADLEYDPSDIPRIVQPILDGQADVVYGTRFHASRSVMRLTNLIMDRALSVGASLLYNRSLTDIETGYRAFRTSTLSNVRIESDRFEFGPELTAKLFRLHARFFEVPVTYSGRIAGKKFGTKDRLSALKTLLTYRFRSTASLTVPAAQADLEEATIIDVRDSVKAPARAGK
jgi:glycosyltransferase involved in cell wall biosynthesis